MACADCAPWQVCNPVTSSCEAAALEVLSPDSGIQVSANASIPVLARLVHDGGTVNVRIPVATNFDATMSTIVFPTPVDISAPGDAGTATFRFGWDGGPREDRTVQVLGCDTTRCEWFQQCEPTLTGGRCINLPLTVSITSPPDDGLYTNAASFALRVTVLSADGGFPRSIPVLFPGGSVNSFVRDSTTSNTYTQQVPLAAPDGERLYVAGWDAGGSYVAERRVTYDTTVPTVTVGFTAVPTRSVWETDLAAPTAWKKDETAGVTVTVNDSTSPVEPVTLSMLSVPGLATDGGLRALAAGSCAGCTDPGASARTRCFCFGADFSKLAMPALRRTERVVVSGVQDRPRNMAGQSSSPQFTVTRLRWSRSFGRGLSSGVQPVAVSSTGLVVAALREATAGQVTAFSPTGDIRWLARDAGIITAGPAIASDVWVATRSGTNNALVSLSLATGAVQSVQCPAAGAAYEGDLAVAQPLIGGVPTDVALAVRAGEAQLRASVSGCLQEGLGAALASGTPVIAVRQTGATLEAFVSRGGTSVIQKSPFVNGAWMTSNTSTLTLAGFGNLRGLMVGSDFVGGGGGFAPDNGRVVLIPNNPGVALTGATPSVAPTATGDAPYGPPSMSPSRVFVGTATGFLRAFAHNTTALQGTRLEQSGLMDIGSTTPVLGRGDLAYVVTASGDLRALQLASTTNSTVLVATGLFSADAIGQPALDVLRDPADAPLCESGLGVFYVPWVSLGDANVTAVLVDSAGLQPGAPWPKYQHDNANTGNASTSLSAWTCP